MSWVTKKKIAELIGLDYLMEEGASEEERRELDLILQAVPHAKLTESTSVYNIDSVMQFLQDREGRETLEEYGKEVEENHRPEIIRAGGTTRISYGGWIYTSIAAFAEAIDIPKHTLYTWIQRGVFEDKVMERLERTAVHYEHVRKHHEEKAGERVQVEAHNSGARWSVCIDGKTFPTMMDVSRRYGLSHSTLCRWANEGILHIMLPAYLPRKVAKQR